MKRKLLTALFGVFAAFASAFADDVNYCGTVVTADGQPIMGATVTVTGTTISTMTDMDGKFQLIVPDGYQTVTITYSGMKKQVVKVQRDPVLLYASAEQAEAAKVVAYKPVVKKKRSYKKNAFTMEYSFGFNSGDWADIYDSDYALGLNLGYKHQWAQYIGWHVIDLGIKCMDISGPDHNNLYYTAQSGLYLATPSWHGISLFGEFLCGVALYDGEAFFTMTPKAGINFGKWFYLAYKYEQVNTGWYEVYDYYSNYWSEFNNLKIHNICIGFNF